jgi:hypothetical protein
MCRLNNTTAYYKASTNTTKKKYKHKTKTLNRQNKNNMAGKKQYKRSTGTKPLNHEKTQIRCLNNATDWDRICLKVVTDLLKISTSFHTHGPTWLYVLVFKHCITLVYKSFPRKSGSFAPSTHPSHPASFSHHQKAQDIDKHTTDTAWRGQWIEEWTACLYAKPVF